MFVNNLIGLYCGYSSIVETMTDINMTFGDYVKLIMKKHKCLRDDAIKIAKDIFEHYLYDYNEVEKNITLLNESKKSRQALINKMHKSTHIERLR